MSRIHAVAKPSAVSQALARDQLGVPAVLFFVLAGVAPLTVAAGVIPTAYATTGLTGIPAAFLLVAVVLAVWATGYVAMTRHITNAGAFYAFIARGPGRPAGIAAALTIFNRGCDGASSQGRSGCGTGYVRGYAGAHRVHEGMTPEAGGVRQGATPGW